MKAPKPDQCIYWTSIKYIVLDPEPVKYKGEFDALYSQVRLRMWRAPCLTCVKVYLWATASLACHLETQMTDLAMTTISALVLQKDRLNSWPGMLILMMRSSNENNFLVTGFLCWEFTGHQWSPLTKTSDAELWCFLWTPPEQTFE